MLKTSNFLKVQLQKEAERGGAGFRSAAAPSSSDMEHALEHRHTDADEADHTAHQEQGRFGNRGGNALDPAESGGEHRGNGGQHVGKSTSGSAFHNFFTSFSFFEFVSEYDFRATKIC